MTMWEIQFEKEHHGKPVPEVLIFGEGALPEEQLTPPGISPAKRSLLTSHRSLLPAPERMKENRS